MLWRFHRAHFSSASISAPPLLVWHVCVVIKRQRMNVDICGALNANCHGLQQSMWRCGADVAKMEWEKCHLVTDVRIISYLFISHCESHLRVAKNSFLTKCARSMLPFSLIFFSSNNEQQSADVHHAVGWSTQVEVRTWCQETLIIHIKTSPWLSKNMDRFELKSI